MARRKAHIGWIELGATCVLIVGLSVLLLPILTRSREAPWRASCQNNLKQMGIVLKMYANERQGGKYPPLSPIPDNWMMDMVAVYPEYVTDLGIFVCPDSPFAGLARFHSPECVSSLFYVYTGFTVLSDEEALALFGSYEEWPELVRTQDSLALYVPVWENSDRVYGGSQSAIPVVWDRVPLDQSEFAHHAKTPGCNVLHMDGHVEFVPYSFYNNSNFFPVTRVSALTFGSVLPRLPWSCYDLRGT